MTREPDVIHLPGNPPVTVHWRRSSRARRLSLKVSRLDGTVTLTLPLRASQRMGMAFLKEREQWLHQAMAGLDGPVAVRLGATIPVEGQPLVLTAAPLRAPRVEDGELLVPANRATAATLAFLKSRARDRLAQQTDKHGHALGHMPGKLTLRDTRSRWGSCTPAGDLMFSWRLIMAPPRILDYVAAHEVAHLAQMNHSPAFWAVVARLFPSYQEARRWLKTEGAALHRYRFDDA